MILRSKNQKKAQGGNDIGNKEEMSVCLCASARKRYIHECIDRQIDRQIDRLDKQIDRYIDRLDKQIDRYIDRQIHRQIDTQID